MLVLLTTITSGFGPISFDVNSTFDFNGQNTDIGWLHFASCTEGSNPLVYNSEYSIDELLDLAQYAITVQFGPSTNIPGLEEDERYTNTADLCSNPVWALNNG